MAVPSKTKENNRFSCKRMICHLILWPEIIIGSLDEVFGVRQNSKAIHFVDTLYSKLLRVYGLNHFECRN